MHAETTFQTQTKMHANSQEDETQVLIHKKKQQLELLFDPHRHQSDFEGKLELTHRSILPVTLGTGVLLDVYMAFNHVCQSFLLFYFLSSCPNLRIKFQTLAHRISTFLSRQQQAARFRE